MRSHPERRQARRPEGDDQAECVIPRVDRGQVEDREADPQARVAVASSLQVEARDRDEQDREVCLRQDTAEQRQRRIGDHVEESAENQRREKGLAPEVPPSCSLAIAHDVSCAGGGHSDRRNDVILAVEDDREDRDRKGREDKRPRFHRVLDRRAGQSEAPDQSGQEVPTLSKGMSVSTAASPTTQALFAFEINAGSAVTTTSSSPFMERWPEGPEGPDGYLASHSSSDQTSRSSGVGSSPDAEMTTRPPSLTQSHASEAAMRAI